MTETKTSPRAVEIPKQPKDSLASVILDAEDIIGVPKPAEVPSEPNPSTANWEAFAKAKLVPLEIICLAYQPVHQHDASCHTRLRLNAESVKTHINHGHGNKQGTGFQFRLKVNDGTKIWGGWKALIDSGVEVADFRCEICDKQVKFLPQFIMPHMLPHAGKQRRILPGGLFNTTLTFNTPSTPVETDDDFYTED